MIYLDNAATAKPCPEAIKAAAECMENNFGNPSSLHRLGIQSEKIITAVKKELLLRLNKEGEIFFTSGATESNNLAIFGTVNALKRRGNRIVTTAIEHPSVSEPLKKLAEQGFEVVSLKPCDHRDFEQAIIDSTDDNTILVCFMAVNNETGFIIDSKRVYEGVKSKNPNAAVHLDGVQGFCKLPLYGDTISLSAHKIHGIKGVGALYKSKKTRLLPIAYGGGQQQGLRSGTEPVELIAGFGAAVKAYLENCTVFNELNRKLTNIVKSLPRVELNSFNAVENIVNFSAEGIRSEIMLHFLEEKEIYVSSGSACSKGKVSPVLAALGINGKRADSAIRVSFCPQNSLGELDLLAEALEEGIKRFRR
ncbi:MAG: cysteine desulfurase [Firmicutes bacterium]|nr:cysteine desulfurase [[Eubacterium] siraeum]MCM1488106.1 cysteine desulfurase [Bacillota bacterium]